MLASSLIRRRLASTVVSDKTTTAAKVSSSLKLSLVTPYSTFYKDRVVQQVNLHNTNEGAMGILSKHVPSLIELKPGLIEIIGGADSSTDSNTTTTTNNNNSKNSKKIFASGGFATINPDNTIDISAMDAYALEDFDPATVTNLIGEYESNLKNTSLGAVEKCINQIQLETLKSLQNSLR